MCTTVSYSAELPFRVPDPFLEVKTAADLIQPTILLTPNTQSLTPNTSYLFKKNFALFQRI